MAPETFQARYCAQRGVAPTDFRADLLRRTLYPHARAVVTVLGWINRQHFQADQEFIEDIGHIRTAAGFSDAAQAFVDHFSNRGFVRGRLRLRISVRRMWRAVTEIMPEEASGAVKQKLDASGSFTPFDKGQR